MHNSRLAPNCPPCSVATDTSWGEDAARIFISWPGTPEAPGAAGARVLGHPGRTRPQNPSSWRRGVSSGCAPFPLLIRQIQGHPALPAAATPAPPAAHGFPGLGSPGMLGRLLSSPPLPFPSLPSPPLPFPPLPSRTEEGAAEAAAREGSSYPPPSCFPKLRFPEPGPSSSWCLKITLVHSSGEEVLGWT